MVVPPPNQVKRKAIICDIDGTLADDRWRDQAYKHPQKDYNDLNLMSKYDMPHPWCLEIIERFHAVGYDIIFLTARCAKGRAVTDAWLRANTNISNFALIMRDDEDFRDDFLIKKDKYYAEIEPHFDVLFALDDKQSVTDMFRSIGVTVLHCAGDKW